MFRDIAQRSVTEILPRVSCIDIEKRMFIENFYKDLKRDLAERSPIDILSRDLAKRPLQEICKERALIEISHSETSNVDLV